MVGVALMNPDNSFSCSIGGIDASIPPPTPLSNMSSSSWFTPHDDPCSNSTRSPAPHPWASSSHTTPDQQHQPREEGVAHHPHPVGGVLAPVRYLKVIVRRPLLPM